MTTTNGMSYSRLTGYGSPWVIMALSRATTGLPSRRADETSSETRITESGMQRAETCSTHSHKQFSAKNFAKFRGPVRKIPRLTAAKSSEFRVSPRHSVCE